MTNDQKDDLILKRNYFERVDRPLVQHHIKNLHSKQSGQNKPSNSQTFPFCEQFSSCININSTVR